MTDIPHADLLALRSHLARLRPGHPALHHISNLIGQIKSYPDNPEGLRPLIETSIQRIESHDKS